MLQRLTPDDPQPQPRWFERLVRARHLFLAFYLLAGIAIIWDLFFNSSSILLDGGSMGRPIEWKPTVTFAIVFLLAPTLFLLGVPHIRWPNPTRGRWIGMTMTLGALWAALISAGVGAALFSLIFPGKDFNEAVSSVAKSYVGLLTIIAIPWAGWLLFFSMVWAGEWFVVFRRLYGLLLAGTCLELLITIPIDVQVRRRTHCYCGEGTFWALTIGITMAFWTFGPGIVMLYLARKMQRMDRGHCPNCGYDLRGSSGLRCPECGTVIRRGGSGNLP